MRKLSFITDKVVIILMLVLLCYLMSCDSNNGNSNRQGKETVFVCTGRYAKRYHYDNECQGLKSCKNEIIEMSKKEAEERGLTPCLICK